MPIYTYRCRTCANEFDIQQRMSESPLSDCPSCGEPQLRKVVNSVGVVFKGSGFYITDNRNGSPKSANGSGSGTGDSAADAPAKKEETTSSATAEAAATGAATAKETAAAPAAAKDTAKSASASKKTAASS